MRSSTGVRARPTPLYAILLCATIGAGLASRRYADSLPAFIARYSGDTLWAAMVFWLLAIIRRRQSMAQLAMMAIAIAFAVEFSQLYHAAWIDSIRATRLGALALGSGFLWSDLVCYAIGVGAAAAIDTFLRRNH